MQSSHNSELTAVKKDRHPRKVRVRYTRTPGLRGRMFEGEHPLHGCTPGKRQAKVKHKTCASHGKVTRRKYFNRVFFPVCAAPARRYVVESSFTAARSMRIVGMGRNCPGAEDNERQRYSPHPADIILCQGLTCTSEEGAGEAPFPVSFLEDLIIPII